MEFLVFSHVSREVCRKVSHIDFRGKTFSMTCFMVFASPNLSHGTVRTYLVDADTLALYHYTIKQKPTSYSLRNLQSSHLLIHYYSETYFLFMYFLLYNRVAIGSKILILDRCKEIELLVIVKEKRHYRLR